MHSWGVATPEMYMGTRLTGYPDGPYACFSARAFFCPDFCTCSSQATRSTTESSAWRAISACSSRRTRSLLSTWTSVSVTSFDSARWARHIRAWRKQKREVFVYFDNDQKSAAPADALRLKSMLKES